MQATLEGCDQHLGGLYGVYAVLVEVQQFRTEMDLCGRRLSWYHRKVELFLLV